MKTLKFKGCSDCYFFTRISYSLDEDIMDGFCDLYDLLYDGKCPVFSINMFKSWDSCPMKGGVIFELEGFTN